MLSFNGYSIEWLDFVIQNRSNASTVRSDSASWDVIFGSVADDDVAREIDDYMELVRKGRVNATVKNALLYQLQYSRPNDQYCIASEFGLAQLRYLESIEVR